MAEDKTKPEPTLDELNADLRARITAGVTKTNQHTINVIQRARDNPVNSAIDRKIWGLMIEASNNHVQTLIEDTYNSSQYKSYTTKDGKVINKQDALVVENNAVDLKKFYDAVKEETRRLGMAGLTTPAEIDGFNREFNSAYEALRRETPKGGLVESITTQFFDPNKGDKSGYQKGGIFGAIVGFGLAWAMGGGFEGGLMGIGLLVIGAILGALGGNMLMDKIDPPNAPTTSPEPSVSIPTRQRTVVNAITVPGQAQAQVVDLHPSGITTVYIDSAGNNVQEPAPDRAQGLMRITFDTIPGKNYVKPSSVALANDQGVFDTSFPVEADRLFNKVKSKEGVDLGTPQAQIDLKYIRNGAEEKIEQNKKAQIVNLDQSGITTVYLDNKGSIVPVAGDNIPNDKQFLMRVTLDSKDNTSARVTNVAVADKDGAFYENKDGLLSYNVDRDKINFPISVNQDGSKSVNLGEKKARAALDDLRASVIPKNEEVINKDQGEKQEQTKGAINRTDKLDDTITPLDSYIKSPQYLKEQAKRDAAQAEIDQRNQKAKYQALRDEWIKEGATVGIGEIKLTPPETSSLPTTGMSGLVALSSQRGGK